MNSSSADLSSANDDLLAAYEDLRHQVLGISEGSKLGPGLALFISRGMLEWMRACVQFFQIVPEKRPESRSQQEPVPASVRTEMVALLAGMLLHRSRVIP